MKALIKVGYTCNDRCVFCHASERRGENATAEEVDRKIDVAARLGHSMVVLSGGEPTIRPELLRWAKRSKARGMAFGLVTNGRLLSSAEMVGALVENGLEYAYVSLHGGSAPVHDAVVGTSGFDETLAGVENLCGRGLDLTVNCVVSRLNIDELIEWVECVSPLTDARLKLSMTEPKGAALDELETIVPTVAEASQAVQEAILHGESLLYRSRILHDGFPLCLLPGLEDRHDDLFSHGFSTMTEAWEDSFFPVDDDNRVRPEPCDECRLRGRCPGLFARYHERLGASELRPVRGPRSNSYNLLPVRVETWRRGEPCPVRGATSHLDRARTIYIRNKERLTLLATKTTDFSRDELLSVKLDKGQIYVDASGKTAVDDFAKDLFKLRRLDACAVCPDASICPGAYKVDKEDVFGRDEARVHEHLSALSGEVLDVGCGEVPYAGIIEPLVRSGRVSYTGIDPDEDKIRRLRRRIEWAKLSPVSLENLELAPETLDHVLLLRSYNHLERPAETLPRLAGALRPGGTLFIVDNVAFGLVRRPGQARRAESSRAQLEHHRNHCASRAAKVLFDTGLVESMRRDVSEETSNQWMLSYYKPPAGRRAITSGRK